MALLSLQNLPSMWMKFQWARLHLLVCPLQPWEPPLYQHSYCWNEEGPKQTYLTLFWQENPQATLETPFVLRSSFSSTLWWIFCVWGFGFYGGKQCVTLTSLLKLQEMELTLMWEQRWDRWIISGLDFVTFRDCLLSQSKNNLYFIACMHISARLLYTGHPKKPVIDLFWKRVGKNHILLSLGGELLLRPRKRKNVGKIFTKTLLFFSSFSPWKSNCQMTCV